MTTTNVTEVTTTDREIITTRLFDAPRELVFEAWTSRDHVGHWFGPNGFTLTIHEMNVKPGGVWRFIMHGPDGTDYPNRVTYHEVVKPERLVFSHGWDVDPDPNQFEVTVTFEEENGKTRVTLRNVFPSDELLKKVIEEHGAIEGGKQTFGRLADYLQNMQ